MSATSACTAGVLCAAHMRTLIATASSSRPISIAVSSASANALSSADGSLSSSEAASSTSDATRSGCVAASSSETSPPSDAPTTWARSIASASSRAAMSSAGENDPLPERDWPKPRMSKRTTRWVAARAGTIGCHMRASATPAWTSRNGSAPSASSPSVHHASRALGISA